MTDVFAAIAHALCDGPCAWQSPDQLAGALGWQVHITEECLCDLASQGLIDPWPDSPDGFVVTLSALAAARLGVTLVLTANSDIYRWSIDSASAMPRRPSASSIERTERHDSNLRSVADPRPVDLGDRIDRDERAEKRFRSRKPLRVEDLPRPTVLLWGHALWPWYCDEPKRARVRERCRECEPKPGPRRKVLALACRPCGFGLRPRPRLDVCPGCRDRPLMRSMYCLRCHRWGLDHVLRKRREQEAAAKAKKRKVG